MAKYPRATIAHIIRQMRTIKANGKLKSETFALDEQGKPNKNIINL